MGVFDNEIESGSEVVVTSTVFESKTVHWLSAILFLTGTFTLNVLHKDSCCIIYTDAALAHTNTVHTVSVFFNTLNYDGNARKFKASLVHFKARTLLLIPDSIIHDQYRQDVKASSEP
ncbi:hypothetical protein J6590_104517 [Homalodisca vitripennis]|nr:hypothetical protein J6590_104517 [Homalodisca vitripennis]